METRFEILARLNRSLSKMTRTTQVYQKQFTSFFQALDLGEITRDEYSSLCDEVYEMLPHYLYETKSLRTRINNKCDGSGARTCGEFALEIYDGVCREYDMVHAWGQHLIDTGRIESYDFQDNGMDNSGCLQYVREAVNCRADFVVNIVGGNWEHGDLLEVKINTRGFNKATFKVHNLEAYITDGASMLVIWVDHPHHWAVISPDEMQRMLDDVPHCFEREMGGMCPCVKLYRGDFQKYFKTEPFVPRNDIIRHEGCSQYSQKAAA